MTAFSDIQEHFRSKNDDELLSLASSAKWMTPESRLTLIEALRRRLETSHPSNIQLIHGWYAVFVHRNNICFPDLCPSCLRKGADTPVGVGAHIETKKRFAFTKNRGISLSIPHCKECADKSSHRHRLIAWPTYTAIVIWAVICVVFHLGKLGLYFGGIFLSLPMVLLLRDRAVVTLGDFGEDWVECRFRSHEYAEAFAALNHVVSENKETIREELEAAIESVRTYPSDPARQEF